MAKSLFSILATIGILASSSTVYASSSDIALLNSTGKVLVNSGNGFEPVTAETRFQTGDDVFVAENASATLHFEKGNCNVVLGAGSVTRISETSLCNETLASQVLPNGMRGLLDEVVITPVNGYVAPPPPPVPTGAISPYVIAGGFLAVGATTLTYAALEKNPTPPAPVTGP